MVSESRGKDPLDKLVTTVLVKDTAGWQLVTVEMEEMHTIYDYDC